MTFTELSRRIGAHIDRQTGTGAKEEDILHAERALGVQLKGEYRQFLRAFGWGGVGSFELYGLGDDVPNYLDLVTITRSERYQMRPRLPLHLIPIMNDGGGNLFCLDVRRDEPPIVLWDHERGEGQEAEQEASSFVEWLNSLLDALLPNATHQPDITVTPKP